MTRAQWPASLTVFGTGALACLFAARLARAGRALTLVGRWPAGLAALERAGVRVLDGAGSWTAPVSAVHIEDPLAPADLVLVLVKSHQTAAVAPHVARARTADSLVLTLQNGLGNDEILAAGQDASGVPIGAEHVAVGVTPMGASLVAPGVVLPGGVGRTVLGRTPANAARLAAVATLLRSAGLETTVAADLQRLVWRKLAVNAAVNALTALHGVPNGTLVAAPDLAGQMDAAAREVGAVAAAAGIDLGADPAALAREVAQATATNRSSMLQDVDRGAPTEVDAIHGAVVRAGRRLGVPTPVNEGLWQAVLALEAIAGGGAPARDARPPAAAMLEGSTAWTS